MTESFDLLIYELIAETPPTETDLFRNAVGRPSHSERSPQTGMHWVWTDAFNF